MRSGFASILAFALLAAAQAAPPAQPLPIIKGARRTSKARGQGSINYAARAARSHAGKPAGYVKVY